ncbi:hypothetical protein CTI12_AA283000 [Artemisia annua]|uniref:Subtilisin-like serine endopeptidase family protein n=1 Tax=Artemisia annua TaxID=35608 RepID=A0A2U1NCG9_ARTAN|nr:hypothetical protein CTI12_AA283000 [Artemisia annua]
MKMIHLLICCLIVSSSIAASSTIHHQRKVFIAYMGHLPEDDQYSPSLHHSEIINQIIDPTFAEKSLIRSYTRSFNGFAAHLSLEEAEKLTRFSGVLSLIPSKNRKLQTTRSWDFMGFPRGIDRRHAVESDVIMGIFDTGIWPESESFHDKGFGPIPKKWKGECAGGLNFTCNKKVIGARSYSINGTSISARDIRGHGTHVASIAAGNEVKHASFFGLAKGTARGGVPSARIAAYKVCEFECNDADILTAFDDAIADGVDIITIAVALQTQLEPTSDVIALGALHALKRGILTVSCAGNSGPRLFTVNNDAPWLLTVAASNIDRRFIDKVLLGDGSVVAGTSINSFPSSEGKVPIVYGKEVTKNCSEADARSCYQWCLERSRIHGKVVICDVNTGIAAVRTSGALGCIVPNLGNNVSEITKLPAAALSENDFNLVKKYKTSTRNPEAKIFKSEAIRNPDAPVVASDSSRGPSIYFPDIMKPDLTAPGVEILAAFSPLTSPSESSFDHRSTKFSILSGTSVACPHVAAAAVYIKSFHPTWSPSVIKSALMTTARVMDPNDNSDAAFAYGSGHIDPFQATDPGLVYETDIDDYHSLWCHALKASGKSTFTNTTCPEKMELSKINYPSMAVLVEVKSPFVVSFPRTVTNVGQVNATYVASIQKGSSKLNFSVEPRKLEFTSGKQILSFVVTVKGSIEAAESVSLKWTDGIHVVHSPIVVYTGETFSGVERASRPPRFLVFIAYMGHLPEDDQCSPSVHHSEIINQIIDPTFAEKSLIRSYTRSFNGFAAYLSLEEAEKLTRFNGVLSVIPSKNRILQTTRSWDFIGFPRVIDRGTWPECFHDDGFGAVPKKWKGLCAGGINFTCNKKIIGARTYIGVSARDLHGHGTHVASIAAGNEVSADGVDVINISIAPDVPVEISYDPIAVGAYHAMEKGILTVSSSDIDRRLVDMVLLGDGSVLVDTSINAFPSSEGESPLVYGKEVINNCTETDANLTSKFECKKIYLQCNNLMVTHRINRNPEVKISKVRLSKIQLLLLLLHLPPEDRACNPFGLLFVKKDKIRMSSKSWPFVFNYAIARKMDPTHNSYRSRSHISSMDDYHKIWCHASKSVANFTLLNATCTPVKLKLTEINYP